MATEKVEQWTCKGQRLCTDGKLTNAWLRPGVEKDLLFSGKSMKAGPGQIFEITIVKEDKDGLLTVRKGKYVGFVNDDARRAEWQAAQDADFYTKEMLNKEKREMQLDYAEVLAPLLRAYRKANPIGRNIIKIKVLKALDGARS